MALIPKNDFSSLPVQKSVKVPLVLTDEAKRMFMRAN